MYSTQPIQEISIRENPNFGKKIIKEIERAANKMSKFVAVSFCLFVCRKLSQSKQAVQQLHQPKKIFSTHTGILGISNFNIPKKYSNPEKADEGFSLTTPCGFFKNIFFRERVQPCFFMTFKIIVSLIFPENFIEIS